MSAPGLQACIIPNKRKTCLLTASEELEGEVSLGLQPTTTLLRTDFMIWPSEINSELLYYSYYISMWNAHSWSLVLSSFPQRWIATKTFPSVLTASTCSWASFQTITKNHIERYIYIPKNMSWRTYLHRNNFSIFCLFSMNKLLIKQQNLPAQRSQHSSWIEVNKNSGELGDEMQSAWSGGRSVQVSPQARLKRRVFLQITKDML